MKVAVTGASGLLGRFVVAALADHEVVAIDRVAVAEHGTHVVDMLDKSALAAALDGCEAVIHLAAIDAARVADEDTFYEVNVLGTWNVLSAAERSGIRRAVVCSSVSALGLRWEAPPRTLPIPVEEKHRPIGAYGLSKQACETLAAGFAGRGRMTVACLRPALVTFPRHVPEWALMVAEFDGTPPPNGVAVPITRTAETISPTRAYIGPEDAARAFAAALVADIDGFALCYVTAADSLSTGPTPENIGRGFGVVPRIARPELYEAFPNASPFDLEPARIALGWQPRDRWPDIVARYGMGDAHG
jgi:nucleoside-diphosphate-sugar epimerase